MSDGLHFRGTYHLRLLRGGHLVREEVAENTLTWQGVTHLLRAGLLSLEWERLWHQDLPDLESALRSAERKHWW